MVKNLPGGMSMWSPKKLSLVSAMPPPPNGLILNHSPRNDRVVHHRLVGLVPEVALVPVNKIRSRPLLELVEFLLRRTDLDTGFNAIGSERPGALDVPLPKHLLLHLRVSAQEVIKGLDIRLRPVGREGQVVVLEVAAYTGQVDDGLDASTAKLVRVTDTRALEDQWRAEGAAADDDLLASTEDPADWLLAVDGLGWHGCNAHGTAVFDDDLVDLGVALEVQVGVLGSSAVDVGVSSIASSSYTEMSETVPN